MAFGCRRSSSVLVASGRVAALVSRMGLFVRTATGPAARASGNVSPLAM